MCKIKVAKADRHCIFVLTCLSLCQSMSVRRITKVRTTLPFFTSLLRFVTFKDTFLSRPSALKCSSQSSLEYNLHRTLDKKGDHKLQMEKQYETAATKKDRLTLFRG